MQTFGFQVDGDTTCVREDSFAVGLLRTEPACQIQPALDKDGKPVPFIIDRYQVTFK